MPSDLTDWTPWGDLWFVSLPGTVTSFSIAVEGTGPDVLRRFVGCVLMMAMPEPGLEEALNSVQDVYQTSWRVIHGPWPKPPIIRRGVGKVVSVSNRPNLVIPE